MEDTSKALARTEFIHITLSVGSKKKLMKSRNSLNKMDMKWLVVQELLEMDIMKVVLLELRTILLK